MQLIFFVHKIIFSKIAIHTESHRKQLLLGKKTGLGSFKSLVRTFYQLNYREPCFAWLFYDFDRVSLGEGSVGGSVGAEDMTQWQVLCKCKTPICN